MQTVARFEKVSFDQFLADFLSCFPHATQEEARRAYDALPLPRRATAGSAGYDFFAPVPFSLKSGEGIRIPTGIRVHIEEGWVLTLYPRSGLGFKYRLQLDNTVGVIDSDYVHSDNQGHIFARLTCDSKSGGSVSVQAGSGFMQGIFLPFGICQGDDVTTVRNGGFGSTTHMPQKEDA